MVPLEDGSQFVRGTVEDAECRALGAEAVATAFRRPLRVEFRFAERARGEVPPRAAVPDAGPAPEVTSGAPAAEPAVVQAALELVGGRVVPNGAV